MKTSTIIRRLTTLSVFAGKGSINIPVIPGVSDFMPFSEELMHNARSKPIIRSSKRFNHHRYSNTGKANPSTPKCNDSQQISEFANSNVSEKNFEIVYNRYCNKAFCWEEYLHLLELLIKAFQSQLEEEPDNKRITIELKKLKRSYRDSLEAFNQFKQTTRLSPEMIPIEPEFGCYCLPDYAKDFQKKVYHYYDKKLTKSRKLARKNKLATRDFFLRQIELNDEDEIVKESKSYVSDYEEYSKIYNDLVIAEKALSSPSVEEAAWAIHTAFKNDDSDLISEKAPIIAEANKILDNYHKALARYENHIGLLYCQDEF